MNVRDTLLVQRPVRRGLTQITEVRGMILPVEDGTRGCGNKERKRVVVVVVVVVAQRSGDSDM